MSDELEFANYITPSHFILGRTLTFKASVSAESFYVNSDDLHIGKKIRNQRLEHF